MGIQIASPAFQNYVNCQLYRISRRQPIIDEVNDNRLYEDPEQSEGIEHQGMDLSQS